MAGIIIWNEVRQFFEARCGGIDINAACVRIHVFNTPRRD